MSHYPQAPQSIGKVLDNGFSLYRAMFKAILPLSFFVAFLAQLPQLIPYLMAGASGGAAALIGLGVLVFIIAWFVGYMAVYNGWIMSMDAIAKGNAPFGVGAAFTAGMPKILSIWGAAILFMLAFMAGLFLLVVPGLILLVSLSFFYYLVLLENHTAYASLKASHGLVWGNWWRTATVMTVGGMVYLVAYGIVFGIGVMILGAGAVEPTPEQVQAGPSAGLLVFLALQVIMNAVMLPMWNSIMLVQFRDLQLRKSGSDLAARAAAA